MFCVIEGVTTVLHLKVTLRYLKVPDMVSAQGKVHLALRSPCLPASLVTPKSVFEGSHKFQHGPCASAYDDETDSGGSRYRTMCSVDLLSRKTRQEHYIVRPVAMVRYLRPRSVLASPDGRAWDDGAACMISMHNSGSLTPSYKVSVSSRST